MDNAALLGKAKRVRIYFNEGDLHAHQPVYVSLLALLRKEGAAGATVVRAIEGFGASGKTHTDRWVELLDRLPLTIEWIDNAQRVARLLPAIKEMVGGGLITVEDTEVVLYSAHPVRDVSALLRVSDVMSRDVVSVAPDASIRKVVECMLGKTYRAIPVVDQGIPVGIVTNSDLVKRGGLSMRVELLSSLSDQELQSEFARLTQGKTTAADVMTPGPVTVHPTTSLTQLAEMMSTRRLKRLPVVDDRGLLVGMVGRFDILRTTIKDYDAPKEAPPEIKLALAAPAARSMRTDVPTVFPSTSLPEVVQAVISSRLNRCLIVDDGRHVLGAITDAELLERITPALRPSALRSLVQRLPFVHPKPAELATKQHATAQLAADLRVDVPVIDQATPLRQAIATMLDGNHKILAVVDSEKRLVGVLDRADVLHGLTLEHDVSV